MTDPNIGYDSPFVTIDEDIFGPGIDWRTTTASEDGGVAFTVLSDQPDLAAGALDRVAPMMSYVGEDGRIVPEDELGLTDVCTPNCVHDVHVFEFDPALWDRGRPYRHVS